MLGGDLIKRTCTTPGCFQAFKCYSKSTQTLCPRCQHKTDKPKPRGPGRTKPWAGVSKQYLKEELPTMSASAGSAPRTPNGASSVMQGNGSQTLAQKRSEKLRSGQQGDTKQQRNGQMSGDVVGQLEIETDKTKPRGTIMPEQEPSGGPKSTLPATVETHRELSADSHKRLKTAALDSMSLLQRSGNRLMVLIEECVSETDLEKAKTGDKRVESHRIEQAIQAANALAATVQTQVNMVRAVADLLGEK